MKEMEGLGVALGQLRTMAGELDEKYQTLLQTCNAADQRSQDIERTFAKIDSLAQIRLGQLSEAGDLAAQVLARVECLSVETGRQLTAMTEARKVFRRDLAHARAKANLRADAAGAPATPADRFSSYLVRLEPAIAAVIHKTTVRPSRRSIVAGALAVLAVVAIVAAWPAGNGNRVGMPVMQSRVLKVPGLPLPELPRGLAPPVPVPITRTVANPVRATTSGFVGQLTVQSSPPGATVFIDGKPVGQTPMSSVRVAAGSHAIWIERPKYRRWTAGIQVRAGRLTTVDAALRLAASGQK